MSALGMDAPYKSGDRVELVSCDDPYTNLKPGDKGTVKECTWLEFSHGWQVWVDWDAGSRLAMLIPHDSIRKVEAA